MEDDRVFSSEKNKVKTKSIRRTGITGLFQLSLHWLYKNVLIIAKMLNGIRKGMF